MATPLTAAFRGQKLTRQATSVAEIEYDFTSLALTSGAQLYAQLLASGAPIFYHSTSGQSQADGYPIPIGIPFTIPLGQLTKIYVSAQAGTGTLDVVIL